MKRSELIREVAYRTGLTQKVVKAVIESEEEVVYETIALNSKIHFLWGTLEGITIPPKRISGSYTQLQKVRKNHGWSVLKRGVPKCTFSKAAKYYDACDPAEWFESPEHRYTTLARTWRKDCGIPEIPEYAGLSEAQIKKMCKKADAKERADMGWGKTKTKEMEYRRELSIRSKLAERYYWEKTGYIPMGAQYDEALGDMNYTGRQRTTVDNLLAKAEKEEDPERKAYYLRRAKEVQAELDAEKEEKDSAIQIAKTIEEKIRKERIRVQNIEKKEERDYYTYGYADETYEELQRIREERMKLLWKPQLEDGEDNNDSEEELDSKKEANESDDDFEY